MCLVMLCYRWEKLQMYSEENTSQRKIQKAGSIPVILGGQEPAYYIDKHNHDGEIVVVARSGASAGFVSYWNQKIFVTDGFGYEEKSELITTKFLYYVLKNMESELNAMKRGAGVPHVSGEMLNSIELQIPLLQEQNRITDILDRLILSAMIWPQAAGRNRSTSEAI